MNLAQQQNYFAILDPFLKETISFVCLFFFFEK